MNTRRSLAALYLNGRSKTKQTRTEEKKVFFLHAKRKFCESNALRSRRILDIVMRACVCGVPHQFAYYAILYDPCTRVEHLPYTHTHTRKDQKGRNIFCCCYIHDIYGYANVWVCSWMLFHIIYEREYTIRLYTTNL